MKFLNSVLSVAAVASLAPLATAHYFFDKTILNGVESKGNQFIRSNTREAKYNPIKWVNVRDDSTPDLDDIRCNKGAFASAGKTSTLEIKAGTKMAAKLAVGATMQHPGPALVYMSKAPTTAATYQGDGDWFKIFEQGVCNTQGDFTRDAWCTWDKDTIEFTVPNDVPNGEYLIRVEHIGIHGAHVGQAEFYPACIQVKVTDGGSGTPGPTVKFPGAYKKDDSSFNFSIYGGFKPYPMPGPAVWAGGNSGGNSGGNGSSSSAPSSTAAKPSATPTTKPAATSTAEPVATSSGSTPSTPTTKPQTGSGCRGKRRSIRDRRALSREA